MIGERVSLHFWLGQFKGSLFDSVVHYSAECLAFYGGVLHIVMKTKEMRVPPFFFSGLSGDLIRFENFICKLFFPEHI